ncbi:NAD(P)/FAD-dependent oxidoreductase [Afipia carboxidovorans]|uniref:phytoene desaturase family protein n=1 Tax=Afipia carboxidovorans TaxID=40137 RepID=UPI003088DC4E|nr:FAD-dependent oxidoreductase [Afipia carboxidovorans]
MPYDIIIVGAGLGGLTSGALLARAGRKVLVIEKSNSVGGAASSYKVGDLFVEGSLHETGNPHDPRDPKHDALSRAGILDTLKWIRADALYEVRGGPLSAPLRVPDDFDGALEALSERFPEARDAIARLLDEMKQIASAAGALAQGDAASRRPGDIYNALMSLAPAIRDWKLPLAKKLQQAFGDNEALKCALAANLCYYHDDPATLWWVYFAMAQGGLLLGGGHYVHGGSQRLSSALAREIKKAGSETILRRVVTGIEKDGSLFRVHHTAKDGSDPKTAEGTRVICNAAPASVAALLPAKQAKPFLAPYESRTSSISLFALTLGLAKPPREFGVSAYSTQLLPEWMTSLADYAQAATLMADEPGEKMPPMAIADYAAIDSGVPAPPYVLSVIAPDSLANWDGLDIDSYRAKRARWQNAIVAHLDRHFPGLAAAVVSASFNTAVSVRRYLGAPGGAVYGFAPLPPRSLFNGPKRTPMTPIEGLYLASAYAGFGGYSGVLQAATDCADTILREA